MKFVYAALLGLVSASTMHAEVRQDQVLLRDELKSLLELVQSVESQEQSQIFDTIEVRKEVLKSLAGEMPERKAAIANEVTNLTNVVSKVLEEDFEGAISELEARKEELVDIHEYLQSLAVEAGEEEFTIVKTNVVGSPGSIMKGFTSMKFTESNTITGGTNWGADNYDADTATPYIGAWSNDPITNPEPNNYASWADTTNVYWSQESSVFFSGTLDGNTITGVYNNPTSGKSGTFVATIVCDLKCQAAKGAAKAGDAIGKGVDAAADGIKTAGAAAKKALQGPNGVAIGLGAVGGLLAICAMCYCYCKKDKGVMSEGSEGGQKQNKESLLVHSEEA